MRLDTPLHGNNARGAKYAVYYASVATHTVFENIKMAAIRAMSEEKSCSPFPCFFIPWSDEGRCRRQKRWPFYSLFRMVKYLIFTSNSSLNNCISINDKHFGHVLIHLHNVCLQFVLSVVQTSRDSCVSLLDIWSWWYMDRSSNPWLS